MAPRTAWLGGLAVALATGCVNGPVSGSLRFAVPVSASPTGALEGTSPVGEPQGWASFSARYAEVCGTPREFVVHRVTLTRPDGAPLEELFGGPVAIALARAERPGHAPLGRIEAPEGDAAKIELDEPADDCRACSVKLEGPAARRNGADEPTVVGVRLDLTAYCAASVP
ncbi:MAG: hypothetical protein IT373_24580 [Polyangiaceae bacterium]|nr:hypothetical protein [Polyangiaceae bacterium]